MDEGPYEEQLSLYGCSTAMYNFENLGRWSYKVASSNVSNNYKNEDFLQPS